MKSMTGFGRGEAEREGYHFTVEIKTVNHRYFEPQVRISRQLAALESEVRSRAKERITRGKTDIFITFVNHSERQETVVINEVLLQSYVDAIRAASERAGLRDNLGAGDIPRLPDVLSTQELPADTDLLWEILKEALDTALDHLNTMREKEGAHLKQDLLEKISVLENCREKLVEKAPLVVEAYKERLHARLDELIEKGTLDPGRLEAEATIFADKCAIDEELTRLESHFKQFRQTLELEEPIGRKLDFLTQELNRETNTIASKANALMISTTALDMKNEIEKIREQIQNIE